MVVPPPETSRVVAESPGAGRALSLGFVDVELDDSGVSASLGDDVDE